MPQNSITFSSSGLKTSDITPGEVREMLGLPLTAATSVAYRAKGWNISDKNKAIINAETGKLYGIFSSNYRLVNHEDGILDVMKAVEKNPEFGSVRWTVGEYDDHKRIMAKGVFTDIDYEVGKGDLVHPSLEYSNSYDGSWSEKLMFGAFRVVCSNGLVVGEKFFQGSAVHSIGSNRDSILIDLDEALHRFSTQTGIWKGWLKKELSLAHLNSAEEIGLTKENHDYIVEETSNNPKIDLWTFYNLMTFVITHRMQSLNRQVQSWNRLRTETSAW